MVALLLCTYPPAVVTNKQMGTLPVWDFGTKKSKQLLSGSSQQQLMAASAAGSSDSAALGGTLRNGDALKSAVVDRYVMGSGTIRAPSAVGDGSAGQGGMTSEQYGKCNRSTS